MHLCFSLYSKLLDKRLQTPTANADPTYRVAVVECFYTAESRASDIVCSGTEERHTGRCSADRKDQSGRQHLGLKYVTFPLMSRGVRVLQGR